MVAIVFVVMGLSACGTLTGLPAHGGGKRFATEQRLVSASIRASLKDIDVTALRGKRAALVFDLVADEGGGSLSGGRWTPGLLFSAGSVLNPVTSTSNAFQVFNLAEAGGNYSNNGSSGSSTTASTSLQSGSNTNNGSSNASGTNTSSGTNTNTSTTNNSGSSSGTNTNATGGTVTNGSFNQSDNSTNVTNGSGTNTNTGSTTQNTTNASHGSSSGVGSTLSTTRNQGSSSSQGGYNSQRETLSPNPSDTVTTHKGRTSEKVVSLQYKGLGDYQNFNVPKSDASLLMGLVRNYMLFNGVIPTTPTDPSAEVLVYVTVDIFGTVRSRFDALLYNNETVKAETSFEISAFDREGKLIMHPQVANRESQYREHYLMWAGPLTTRETVYQGQGLLVDFTDVDGTKANYNSAEPVLRSHILGKN